MCFRMVLLLERGAEHVDFVFLGMKEKNLVTVSYKAVYLNLCNGGFPSL